MLILILPWSKCQKPCMRRPHCRPKAARSRLTPTLLNPYRFRKVMRKPKPMKIMTWTSWNTAERRGEVSCAADSTLLEAQTAAIVQLPIVLVMNVLLLLFCSEFTTLWPFHITIMELTWSSFNLHGRVCLPHSDSLVSARQMRDTWDDISLCFEAVMGYIHHLLWENYTPVFQRSFLISPLRRICIRNPCAQFKP